MTVCVFLPHGLVILVMDMNIGLVYTSPSKSTMNYWRSVSTVKSIIVLFGWLVVGVDSLSEKKILVVDAGLV